MTHRMNNKKRDPNPKPKPKPKPNIKTKPKTKHKIQPKAKTKPKKKKKNKKTPEAPPYSEILQLADFVAENAIIRHSITAIEFECAQFRQFETGFDRHIAC
jgi:hypothetical protein